MRRKNRRNASRIVSGMEGLESRQMLAADLVSFVVTGGQARDGNLVATFDGPVEPGSGAANIVLRSAADDSILEVIGVHDTSKVTFAAEVVTIDPTTRLAPNTEYRVTIDEGAIRELDAEVTSRTIFSEDFEDLPLMSSTISLHDSVVVISGTLNVAAAGAYTFGGNSHYGQLLAIDVNQDGLDVNDDQLIFDDTPHVRDDRLHTCGVNAASGSCRGVGEEDSVELAAGAYAFEYWFLNRNSGQGGEFFYAPGYHEVFSVDDFAIVGDDSKGIGVTTDGITATTYEAASTPIRNLAAANQLIQGAEDPANGYPVSAAIEFADVSSGGRFNHDHSIPRPMTEDWTNVPPTGWQADTSNLIDGGAPEYHGFTFLDKDWWIAQQIDQNRSDFVLGEGTVLVADPDAHDDFIDNGGVDRRACENILRFGPECGLFTASVSTAPISLADVVENSAQLRFDSSWWDEDTQSAETRVEYFDATGDSIGTNVLLRWESLPNSENYKPQFDPNTGINARNERIQVAIGNPANAATMKITFDMPYATNDWWWAIDNIVVSEELAVAPSPSPAIDQSVITGDVVSQFLPADLDKDGQVGFSDFQILQGAYGETVEPVGSGADIDGSGVVDFADFLLLSAAFGQTSTETPLAAAADSFFADDDA